MISLAVERGAENAFDTSQEESVNASQNKKPKPSGSRPSHGQMVMWAFNKFG